MSKTFYITTPIYYVNSHPHIGHAYTTIATDVFTRYRRLFGEEAYFLTGTDEHGQKIAESAAQAGIDPQEFVNRMAGEFREMWPPLHIAHDQFIRTTDPEHKSRVQAVLQKIHNQGEIYLKEYEGLYCVGCERFLDESELTPEGDCPDHQKPPQPHKERNYFFRMSAYQEWLVQLLEGNPELVYPGRYRNELLRFLEAPLQDLCISRPKSRLSWGIKLPFDRDFVTYVWFDALLNYPNALGWPDAPRYQKFWPHCHHIIGKDILKTHGIYWPCMLKSAGIPMFKKLVVHGHWVIGGSKMSKSLGNVVSPLDMKARLGVDALRYFLLREMSFGEDANFTEALALARYNGDLANNLGNLISRSITLSRRNFDGQVPPCGELTELETNLRREFTEGVGRVQELVLVFQPHRALELVTQLSSAVNKYIDEHKPWKLAKEPEQHELLGTVLYTALDSTRILVGLLQPVMPEKMAEAQRLFGMSEQPLAFEQLVPGALEPGTRLPEPAPLFPKLQMPPTEPAPKPVKKQQPKPAPKQQAGAVTSGNGIGMEIFQQIRLKVGIVRKCRRVEKSDKLLISQIDLGEGRLRSIVSGVAEFYTPEQMVGKRVVVVANLKPVKLRGELSEGMLLALDDGTTLTVLEAAKTTAPGTPIR
ncbi:MAG: methionine--tRNA ligase [Deltaproteobacteria bacterium]|nr:methionine--tRNA ligase [Deltaproteobacteria bacterium]